jgi:hypothetical protein
MRVWVIRATKAVLVLYGKLVIKWAIVLQNGQQMLRQEIAYWEGWEAMGKIRSIGIGKRD